MARISVVLDIIQEGGRTFVLHSPEDLAYERKITNNRLTDLASKISQKRSQIVLEREDDSPEALKRVAEIEGEVENFEAQVKILESLRTRWDLIEEKRAQLITKSETLTLELIEPDWGTIIANEERFKKLLDNGTYVVDHVGAMTALLRTCCPEITKQRLAVADRMMMILRRYTEVDNSDLPFIL